jgi:hypothetical protein
VKNKFNKQNIDLVFLARIFLSIVFLLSAVTKLVAPGIFEITILNYGVIESRELATYFSRLLLVAELFIGLAFLQPNYLKRIIIPSSIIILIVFTIFLANFAIEGNSDNCGCFGEVIIMSPIEAIIKNIILIFISIYVFASSTKEGNKITIPTITLIASIIIVLVFAPIKSLKDLKFSKYTNFSNGKIADLNSGDKLLAIFFIDCEHCQEVAKDIVELEKDKDKIDDLYILIAGEETDSVNSFISETEISQPYIRIPINDFFELIGSSPPRLYWLKHGKIYKFWDDDFITNIQLFLNSKQ